MLAWIRALVAKDQDAAAEEVRYSLYLRACSACMPGSILSSQILSPKIQHHCAHPQGLAALITTRQGPQGLAALITTPQGPQGLAALFTTQQSPKERAVLEAVAILLSPQNRAAAATSCTALAAAVRSLTTNLSIQAKRDLRAATARASEDGYPRVVCLELKSPAANVDPATTLALLSALSDKLQQLTAHGLKPQAIASMQCLGNFQQLRSLHLSFPNCYSLQVEDCYNLNSALEHLTSLTQLSLSIADRHPLAEPLKALRHLTKLQQLSLGGKAWVSKLPPALTSLTLAGRSGRALPLVSSCLQLQQLRFEAAEPPADLSTPFSMWEVLTPLTALTSLEGTLGELGLWLGVGVGGRVWGGVGSDAPESLPVVQRLRRLAVADTPGTFLMDEGVHLAIEKEGDMHTMTNLEVLWVCCNCPDDVPGLPSSLRELRLRLGFGLHMAEPLDLRSLNNLSKLTLEVYDASFEKSLLLPTSLEELTLVTDVDGELSVPALPAPLPKLKRFNSWGNGHKVQKVDVENIFRMSPCLEQVQLYVTSYTTTAMRPCKLWTEEYVRVVCLVRRQLAAVACKPEVMICQLDSKTKEVTETMTL